MKYKITMIHDDTRYEHEFTGSHDGETPTAAALAAGFNPAVGNWHEHGNELEIRFVHARKTYLIQEVK